MAERREACGVAGGGVCVCDRLARQVSGVWGSRKWNQPKAVDSGWMGERPRGPWEAARGAGWGRAAEALLSLAGGVGERFRGPPGDNGGFRPLPEEPRSEG